jgi:sulfide dehydrogenase [flavocytochrome c] flavoprotein chain
MDRRSFVKSLGIGAVAASTSLDNVEAAVAKPFEIVVVGGGFGGASIAKYLKLWGQSNINVTLIDGLAAHVSCILSNLVLNNQKTLANLSFNLSKVAVKNHFTFRQGLVNKIDKAGKKVFAVAPDKTVFSVTYDKLVLSPGISFVFPTGMDPTLPGATTPIPHAWKAGLQTANLRAQLRALPSNGSAVVVMTIPKAPYRCPPGPYERACLIADFMKRTKNGGKLIVFDANPGILAEPINFGKAFTQLYQNIIEYVPNHSVVSVSGTTQFATKSITVTNGTFSRTETCHLLNVIPNQIAPKLLFDAGLIDKANGKQWAGVHLDTYQSLFNPHIYVIGDAHDSNQPKAGHIANSEAKVCADAILRTLGLLPPRVMPDEAPVTNSACYSPITATTASFLTAGYRFDPAQQLMVRIPEAFGEAETINSDNYKTMLAWANNLFADVF